MALEKPKNLKNSSEAKESQGYLAGEFSAMNEVQESLFELLFERYRTDVLDDKLSALNDVEKRMDTATLMKNPEYQKEFQEYIRKNIKYNDYLELMNQVNPEITTIDGMMSAVVLTAESEILSVEGYRELYRQQLTYIAIHIEGWDAYMQEKGGPATVYGVSNIAEMGMSDVRQALTDLPQLMREYLEQSLPPSHVEAKIREIRTGGRVTLADLQSVQKSSPQPLSSRGGLGLRDMLRANLTADPDVSDEELKIAAAGRGMTEMMVLESERRRGRETEVSNALQMKGLTGGVMSTYPLRQFQETRPLADRKKRSMVDQMDQYMARLETKDRTFAQVKEQRNELASYGYDTDTAIGSWDDIDKATATMKQKILNLRKERRQKEIEEYIERVGEKDPKFGVLVKERKDIESQSESADLKALEAAWKVKMVDLSIDMRLEQMKKHLTPRLLQLMSSEWDGDELVSSTVESKEALREQLSTFVRDYYNPELMSVDVPGRQRTLPDGTSVPFQIHFLRKDIDFFDMYDENGQLVEGKNPLEAMLFGMGEKPVASESWGMDYVIDAQKTDMSTLTHMGSMMSGVDRFGSNAGVLYAERQFDAQGNILDIQKKIVTGVPYEVTLSGQQKGGVRQKLKKLFGRKSTQGRSDLESGKIIGYPVQHLEGGVATTHFVTLQAAKLYEEKGFVPEVADASLLSVVTLSTDQSVPVTVGDISWTPVDEGDRADTYPRLQTGLKHIQHTGGGMLQALFAANSEKDPHPLAPSPSERVDGSSPLKQEKPKRADLFAGFLGAGPERTKKRENAYIGEMKGSTKPTKQIIARVVDLTIPFDALEPFEKMMRRRAHREGLVEDIHTPEHDMGSPIDFQDPKNPKYLSLEAAITDHKDHMTAWVEAGEIHFRASKLAQRIGSKLKYFGCSDEIQVGSRTDSEGKVITTISVGEGATKETFDADDFFTVETFAKLFPTKSREVALAYMDVAKSAYDESRDRMWRHEEAHRLFEYFGVHELGGVSQMKLVDGVWEVIDGKPLTLTEEELCRLAEQDFGAISQPEHPGYIALMRESGEEEVVLSWGQVNKLLSEVVDERIAEGVEVTRELQQLRKKNDVSLGGWYTLISRDPTSGAYMSKVSDIGESMMGLYSDERFSELYEARTEGGLSKKNLKKLNKNLKKTGKSIDSFGGSVAKLQKPVDQLIDATNKAGKDRFLFDLQQSQSQLIQERSNIQRLIDTIDHLDGERNIEKKQQTMMQVVRSFENMDRLYQSQIAKAKSGIDIVTSASEKKKMSDMLDRLHNEYIEVLQKRVKYVEDLKDSGVTSLQDNRYRRSNNEDTIVQDLDDARLALITGAKQIRDYAKSVGNVGLEKKMEDLIDMETGLLNNIRTESDETVGTFDSERNSLAGDQSVEIKNGALLYLRTRNSDYPGGGTGWMKCEVVGNSPSSYKLKIKGYSEKQENGNIGQLSERQKTPEDLLDLKSKFGNGVFRMPPEGSKTVKNMAAAADKIRSAGSLGFKRFGDGWSAGWGTDYVDERSKRYYEETGGVKGPDDIKYLAYNKGPHEHEFYEIDQGSKDVTISVIDGDQKAEMKTMDYATFVIWVADKGLTPYTQPEYDMAKKDYKAIHANKAQTKVSFMDRFMNWNSLKKAVLNFPTAITAYRQEREDYQAAKFYARAAGGLKGIGAFNIGDVGYDAIAELDSKIRGTINKWKGRLGDDDRAGIHKGQASKRIQEEIFNNPGTGEQFKQKAAGYLLYALDKGNPYFRDLSENDPGMWVKILLGEHHYKVFLDERARKEAELKNSGQEFGSDRNELIMFEVQFLEDKLSQGGALSMLYGSQFPKAVGGFQEREEEMYSGAKGGLAKLGSFKGLYGAVESFIGNLDKGTFVAGLELLLDKMEYDYEYEMVYGLIMRMYASGFGPNVFGDVLAGKLKTMGRTYGMPLLLFAKDPHATRRVVNIVDAISEEQGRPSLTKFMKTGFYDSGKGKQIKDSSYDADNVRINDFHKGSIHKDRSAITAEWWKDNARYIVPALQFSDTSLFSARARAESKSNSLSSSSKERHHADQVKADIDEYYLKKVHDGETRGDGAIIGDAYKAAQGPAYRNGVLNLSKGGFENMFLKGYNPTSGKLRDDNQFDMRETLRDNVNAFDTRMSGNDDLGKEYICHMIVKKFINYFEGRHIQDTDLKKLQNAMKSGKSNVVVQTIERMRRQNNRDPPVMRQGLKAFERFFVHHARDIARFSNEKTNPRHEKGVMVEHPPYKDVKY